METPNKHMALTELGFALPTHTHHFGSMLCELIMFGATGLHFAYR